MKHDTTGSKRQKQLIYDAQEVMRRRVATVSVACNNIAEAEARTPFDSSLSAPEPVVKYKQDGGGADSGIIEHDARRSVSAAFGITS